MPEPTTPTAAVTPYSTIGVKGLVIAPLTTDTETTLTYGTLQEVAGTIEIGITPGSTDPDVQYYDDSEGDVINPDPDHAVKIKLADLPLKIRAMLENSQIDDNGVMVSSANDKPGYFAIGFKSEKSNHKYRYVWLLKCRLKPFGDTFATKEGTSITRQTPEAEFQMVKRNYDRNWRFMADEDENEFSGTVVTNFLQSVYTPSFTSSGDGD